MSKQDIEPDIEPVSKKVTTFVHLTHPDTQQAVVLKPGDTVPAWAKDLVTNPKAFAATASTPAEDQAPAPDNPSGQDSVREPAGQGQGGTEGLFDPAAHNADEVNNHLAESDVDEVARVIAAEKAGKHRKGIIEGPYAPDEDDDQGRGTADGSQGQGE
jgi:hypothetical protein